MTPVPHKNTSSLPKPTLIGTTPGHRTPIYVEAACLENVGKIVSPGQRRLSVIVVIDRTVDRLCGPRLCRSLETAGWIVRRWILRGGESVKSQRTVTRLHADWFTAGVDRSTPVLAVGGGTITDSVGFAAATFLRGLPLWHLPTTIVGQVDAAIGGKVGISTAHGKNLIGCFYQPTGVIIDPQVLSTLPVRERRAGLAEIVKYGVIADPVLFRRCERDLPAWIAGSRPIAADVIRRCLRIKLRLVARDESDHGVRRILNFGHTLGHAFERWGGYRRFRHGEAVALGMVGAAAIARNRGLLSESEVHRLTQVCGLLVPRQRREMTLPTPDIMKYLRVDKKRTAGRNVWILPRSIGEVLLVDDVVDEEIKIALGFVRRWLHESRPAGEGR
jgi:3-dehydroquinate synthase